MEETKIHYLATGIPMVQILNGYMSYTTSHLDMGSAVASKEKLIDEQDLILICIVCSIILCFIIQRACNDCEERSIQKRITKLQQQAQLVRNPFLIIFPIKLSICSQKLSFDFERKENSS